MSNNEPIVKTSDAAIRTVSVEIKILTVSNKQMTLAVFRQLRLASWDRLREELIHGHDDNIWGVVNYCSDVCENGYKFRDVYGQVSRSLHWHVVWSHDGELRHTVVKHWEAGDWSGYLSHLDQLFIAV